MLNNALISPLSIAPMIDWTYTHFRVLMRILAPNALLYTEMHTTNAIIHNTIRCLDFNSQEHPLALQLGGNNRNDLITCAKIAENMGYSEINLNLGCPSDKVLAGQFGACLMTNPQLVSDCISGLKNELNLPVTAKIRIGIDHQDSYEFFSDFVAKLVDAGCDKIIVHARKAWLNGLSPKQNRTIPPLHYDYVYKIKQDFQHIPIIINGNIQEVDEMLQHLMLVDGVMLGRLACNNPYQIAVLHHKLYPSTPLIDRKQVLKKYYDYLQSIIEKNTPISLLLKPIFNMAHNISGAKLWKQSLMQVQQSKSINNLYSAIETSFG